MVNQIGKIIVFIYDGVILTIAPFVNLISIRLRLYIPSGFYVPSGLDAFPEIKSNTSRFFSGVMDFMSFNIAMSSGDNVIVVVAMRCIYLPSFIKSYLASSINLLQRTPEK